MLCKAEGRLMNKKQVSCFPKYKELTVGKVVVEGPSKSIL